MAYKLHTLPGNDWLVMIKSEYDAFKKDCKPRATCVTFLIFSGISYPAFTSLSSYFPEEMANSYANAFQVHQRPVKTAEIHKKWIRKLPYIWYLVLVAVPVDVYAHVYQFVFGQSDAFLEGGAFFIPYQVAHWTLLLVAFFAKPVHDFVPKKYWPLYFKVLRFGFVAHEHVYGYTLRKLSLRYRLIEFTLFVLAMVAILCVSVFR